MERKDHIKLQNLSFHEGVELDVGNSKMWVIKVSGGYIYLKSGVNGDTMCFVPEVEIV